MDYSKIYEYNVEIFNIVQIIINVTHIVYLSLFMLMENVFRFNNFLSCGVGFIKIN